jgi:hypothetical protein
LVLTGLQQHSSTNSDAETSNGSAQEFVETRISGCFLKNDEFCFCDRHALRFEQQIAEILVAPTPSKKGLDVAVEVSGLILPAVERTRKG